MSPTSLFWLLCAIIIKNGCQVCKVSPECQQAAGSASLERVKGGFGKKSRK